MVRQGAEGYQNPSRALRVFSVASTTSPIATYDTFVTSFACLHMTSTAVDARVQHDGGSIRARKLGEPEPARQDNTDDVPPAEGSKEHDAASEAQSKASGDKVVGRTPDGTVFTVPHTPDMLTSIFAPNKPKTALDLLTIASLTLQIVLFLVLRGTTREVFFFLYFAFWRGAYNGGLGYILKAQSEKKWMIKVVKQQGWFDFKRRPRWAAWVKSHLKVKMEKDYVFEAMPLEYNVWLMFRSIVDVILLNDFVSYSLFAFSCLRLPEGHSVALHILRWVAGWTLIFFNLWVKMDAHRVVKDYAWYWGDCFFLCLQSLVFDGVYECAPDPMYSLGYAGYYGLSLVSGSYAVLFVSLAAHASQFMFLKWFEGPHIDRVYGEKKPLAARVPLKSAPYNVASAQEAATPGASKTVEIGPEGSLSYDVPERPGSPSLRDNATQSVSSSVADPLSSTEDELSQDENVTKRPKVTTIRNNSQDQPSTRPRSDSDMNRSTNLHDLNNKLFQHDVVVFRNLDPLRGSDFLLIVAVFYGFVPHFLPHFGPKTTLAMYFINALAWRLVHSFGLGALLHAQSQNKWMVRHYLKHYIYNHNVDAVYAAFSNWKVIYNTSLVMTYTSFGVLCWKCYAPLGRDWTAGTDLLRHVLGALLVALHVWTATSSYSVLGPLGWLYADFFGLAYPHQLYYTGIYRFLNNPERTMGGAAFFGLALISGSKLASTMAVISYIAHWLFLSKVENPHMTKLYGEAAVSREGGITKQLKSVAERNEFLSAAQSHPKVKEMRGQWQRYQRDAATRFDDLVTKSKPAWQGMVKDTRTLIEQSKDRLLIVRSGNDVATIDREQYGIELVPGDTSRAGTPSYSLGKPIQVRWKAPVTHSPRDWMGLYLVSRLGGAEGADESRLLTRISSQGKWIAIEEDEWNGDAPLHDAGSSSPSKRRLTQGTAVFQCAKLPWAAPGTYEVRYHHDAKHNVLARSQPFAIVAEHPEDRLSYQQTHAILSRKVSYALLDSDSIGDDAATETAAKATDPDDFTIWSVEQAKRIADAIHVCFGVEFTTEVIVAEANVGKLANDIVEAHLVLGAAA